ncbi:hypothetical protein BaRGS_00035471, partial [Batillaria attramentaria]
RSASATALYRFVVIGKTGNGKSDTCNTILGRREFKVGRGMTSTTLQSQYADAQRFDTRIMVLDTPDVTDNQFLQAHAKEEVARWLQLTGNNPSAFLLAVRCDFRYTPEEYSIYGRILQLIGKQFVCDRLIVAFTFGDQQDRSIEEELELPTASTELRTVLRDARHRYVIFNNKVVFP